MANLQIKGIDDEFFQEIKELAAAENRSVSQQILYITRRYLALAKESHKTGAKALLELADSWESKESAEEIIQDIVQHRVNSSRLKDGL